MGYNILLVDDSNVVKAVLSKILAGSPLPIDQVYDAANGVEALKILNADTIDLVITDINMPLMDGFELIERMRLDMMLKDIPVIVISTEGASPVSPTSRRWASRVTCASLLPLQRSTPPSARF